MTASLRAFVALALLALGLLPLWAQAPARPTARALRLPEKTIVIDGRDTDWRRARQALADSRVTADTAASLRYANPERGSYTGPADLSLAVNFAVDAENLYLLADVHDDILINDATRKEPFFGDDFEVFIDASPAETRFANAKSENFRQFIFVPGYVNPAFPGGIIWQAETCPGVAMASRLHPWGYTIEVRIPKALLPNWKAHPELDSLGIDVMVTDADAAGVDAVHPAIKHAAILLSPGDHFLGPEKLGLLTLDAAPATISGPIIEKPRPSLDALLRQCKEAKAEEQGAALAESLLSYLPGTDAAQVAAAALASPLRAPRQAGLLILAKRPELAAPLEALQPVVNPVAGKLDNLPLRTYALAALAQRKRLPVLPLWEAYLNAEDPAIRLSFLFYVGVNGDRSMTPKLLALLKDERLRVRMMAALSLGTLGDPSALDALRAMAKDDAHQYGRKQAELAIAKIEQQP